MMEAVYSWNLFLRYSRGDYEAYSEFVEWLSSLATDPLQKAYMLRLSNEQIAAIFAMLSPLNSNLDELVEQTKNESTNE
jgi:hypothetical protein